MKNSIQIDVEVLRKLLEIADKSICLINNETSIGTGFLIKIPIHSKKEPLYGLMTANHVLPSECIKPNKAFEIKFRNKSFMINLNNKDFVFTSDLIDITFIQLTNNIYFNDPDINFISSNINENESYEDKTVIITQYPKGKQHLASGKIKSKSSFNYYHTVSTDNGSSGSPLIKNDDDLSVIGIHKSIILNKNVATEFSTVVNIINILYNKKYIYDIKKAREEARKLTKDEIKELNNYGLEQTKFYNIFCFPFFPYDDDEQYSALFYKTNHGWYCCVKDDVVITYEMNYFKSLDWIFINPYEPIEKIINKISNVNIDIGIEKLEHRLKVIIMYLKLSEFKYI